MRITNQMMVNSSISNIQGNKSQLNDLSTQLSTQKKINKPSDDPIIAIRALRLRSSLDEVTQYLGKNIPDASSWLSVTHDALDESNKIIQDLYNYCVQVLRIHIQNLSVTLLLKVLTSWWKLIISRGMLIMPEDMYLQDMLQISL